MPFTSNENSNSLQWGYGPSDRWCCDWNLRFCRILKPMFTLLKSLYLFSFCWQDSKMCLYFFLWLVGCIWLNKMTLSPHSANWPEVEHGCLNWYLNIFVNPVILQPLQAMKLMEQSHLNPDAFQELTNSHTLPYSAKPAIIPALWLWDCELLSWRRNETSVYTDLLVHYDYTCQ